MNCLVVTGRLVADPTSGVSKAGKHWCRMRLAVARPRRDGGDMFITAVAFGPLADSCSQWLTTGRTVGVQGWLDDDETTGADGQPVRGEHQLMATAIDFLDAPPDNDEP